MTESGAILRRVWPEGAYSFRDHERGGHWTVCVDRDAGVITDGTTRFRPPVKPSDAGVDARYGVWTRTDLDALGP